MHIVRHDEIDIEQGQDFSRLVVFFVFRHDVVKEGSARDRLFEPLLSEARKISVDELRYASYVALMGYCVDARHRIHLIVHGKVFSILLRCGLKEWLEEDVVLGIDFPLEVFDPSSP